VCGENLIFWLGVKGRHMSRILVCFQDKCIDSQRKSLHAGKGTSNNENARLKSIQLVPTCFGIEPDRDVFWLRVDILSIERAW